MMTASVMAQENPEDRSAWTAPQMAQVAASVEAGPDQEKDGVLRWRKQNPQRRIATAP